MAYNILGYDYELPIGLKNVLEIQKYYSDCAKEIYADWEDDILQKNMDELMIAIDDEFFVYLSEAVKKAISKLSEYKIYTYNLDAFVEKIDEEGIANGWFAVRTKIENEYVAILEEVEEAAQYRAYRKENRPQLIGLTRRGKLDADDYNTVTGAVHSVANFVGNMSSNAKAKKKKQELFIRAVGVIEESFKDVVKGFAYLTVSIIMNEYTEPIEFEAPSIEDTKKASGLLDNLINGNIPQEEAGEIVHDILQLNPTLKKLYVYLIKEYGDEDGEIHRLTEALYIDSLDVFISNTLKDKLCDVNYLKKEEIEQSKNKIIQICQRWGVDSSTWIEPLDIVIQLHQKSEMSCDGHIYQDKESLNIAKSEKDKFLEYTDNLDGNNEERLLEIKTALEKFESLSKDKYLDFIVQALSDYDCRYRIVNDKEYSSREEADDMKAGIDFVADLLESSDLSNIKQLELSLEKLATCNLDNIPIEQCKNYIEEAISSINNFNDKLNNKMYNGRLEQASYVYDLMLAYQKVKFLNCVNENTKAELEQMLNEFKTINDKVCSTFLDANRTYYKKLSNAYSYLNNVVQKESGKKSFFAKIADGTKEMLSKGYEPDYNYFNAQYNGVLPELPEDIKTVLGNMDKEYNSEFTQLQTEYQNKYALMGKRWKMEEKVLEGKNIIEKEYEVTHDEINDVLSKYIGKLRKLKCLSTENN